MGVGGGGGLVVEVTGGEKCGCVREIKCVCVCVCAARYKEGQWRGSGIIWRGRCCNILSWITALYTGEMDGWTTDRQWEGGKGKKEEEIKKKDRDRWQKVNEKSIEQLGSPQRLIWERVRVPQSVFSDMRTAWDIFSVALRACWSCREMPFCDSSMGSMWNQ